MVRKLFIFGIVFSLVIRFYFILNGSEIADVHSLHEMGELALKGTNPYLALSYNTYPPLALYLEEATIKISQFLNIPFHIIIKIWPNLTDILTALVLYKFLIKRGAKETAAYIWSLIFLLNPVSIIISAAHGQLDSIPSFLVVLSLYILLYKQTKYFIFLSALFLGLAISIKPNSLILLPFFLTFQKGSLKEKSIFLFAVIVIPIVLFLPFIQSNSEIILQRIFNYSGSKDIGLPVLLRGWYYLKTADYNFLFIDQIIGISKIFFLVLLFFAVFIYSNSKKLIRSCLVAYLLFITFYFGISVQYLGWILPLAVLQRDKMIIPYSLSAFLAMLGFYLFFNPAILTSQFSSIPLYQKQFMLLYVLGNLMFWIITLYWLIKILALDLFGKRIG